MSEKLLNRIWLDQLLLLVQNLNFVSSYNFTRNSSFLKFKYPIPIELEAKPS